MKVPSTLPLVAALACAFLLVSAAPRTLAQQSAEQFDTQIAPILTKHCLQCHNAKAKKGGLDLSRKDTALAGGKSGKALQAGSAGESLLWKQVEAGKMPKGRGPLSDDEQRTLREWIESGAVWSDKVLEPAVSDQQSTSTWVRRLTLPEYIQTVRSTLDVDIEEDARRLLPLDLRADGFSNTAYNLGVDLAHVEAYARLAEIIAARVDAAALAAQYSEKQDLTDDNLRRVIAGLGKWLLRGPLEKPEIDAYLALSQTVANEGGGFHEAVRYVLEAMLQSPRFVYHLEKQANAKPDQYELASRLSYILWGGPPDTELLRAAEAGELSDRSRVAAQVERMLADPRAIAQSTQFISQWMYLERLDTLQPSKKRFPKWNPALASDMRAETIAFFKHVAWEQKRLVELFNTRATFVTPRLARHYGIKMQSDKPQRSSESLEMLYDFREGSGNVVHDQAAGEQQFRLQIDNPSQVEFSGDGLVVKGPVLLVTAAPPRKLIDAVRQSKAISWEAWITPADTKQAGPARILTLSSGPNQRNFTLGQDGDKYEVRFRAKGTNENGMPGLTSPAGSAQTKRTQVVFTRDAAGKAKLYIDGKEVAAGKLGGDLADWKDGYHFALANEIGSERPWRGTLHRVAIYSRALSPEEIRAEIEPVNAPPARYDLSATPGRGGLLTHGSVLTIGGDEASMVTRGLFVLRELLYSGVEDPPPCVDTTPVPTKPGQSQRSIAMQRLDNKACAGCHAKFEPLAFGLERFDGVGAYHEADEHSNQLREDGEILFPDQEKPVAYKTSTELMNLLAGSERVKMAITRKVTQFALARPLSAADEPALQEIHASAQKGGGTYASLITAIVMSDLVQGPSSPLAPPRGSPLESKP